MVDHTFLFTGAVKKINEVIKNKTLGKLYYYDSTRINLGLVQNDINVIWDLAPHDLSIMNYIIKEKPLAVCATGAAHFKNKMEDVAYLTVYLEKNILAHFNVSWISPVKVRHTLIGGTKKMLVWNDLKVDEPVKIYDRGLKVSNKEDLYNLLVDYRSGDIWTPLTEKKRSLS